MNTYLVVWESDFGVVQSVVKTDKNPSHVAEFEWVEMAAESEEIELGDSQGYNLYLVIDYPKTFYV